jgi:transcriptional regulator with XRE-family HTH domain
MKSSGRVRIVREKLELSQEKFAIGLGVSRSYVMTIESGRAEPSFSFVTALRNTYQVNINWIITGEGGMFLPSKSSIFDDINSTVPVQPVVILQKLEAALKQIDEGMEALTVLGHLKTAKASIVDALIEIDNADAKFSRK